jgi:hypothetical protein
MSSGFGDKKCTEVKVFEMTRFSVKIGDLAYEIQGYDDSFFP